MNGAAENGRTEKISATTEVTTAELAAVLGVTASNVLRLTKDGILIKPERGRYVLADSVQRYVKFKTKAASTDGASLEKEKLAAEVDFKRAKAKAEQLKAAELEGKMHRSEDVEAVIGDMIDVFRAGLLALPGRLAMDTANAKTAAETADIIRSETYKLAETLSAYEYDPQKYADRVRARMKWEASAKEDDEDGE